MERTSILVVEDERKIARLLEDYLVREGHEVTLEADGDRAIERIVETAPALVILDLMLPGRGGLDICRQLRAFSSVPVIMLTARVDEQDRLEGFEAGADDYVCKPFSPAELVARVRSVLRRVETGQARSLMPTEIVYRDVRLDLERHRCVADGQPLELTPVEFRMLREMMGTPGRVYSRYQLMRLIYDDHRIVSDRTIDSHVRNLRRKLPDSLAEGFIRSSYGVGYSIV